MELRIREILEEIEAKEDIQILYACESGSRAWGFPSPDSDYDVRFIYARPLKYYLTIGDYYKGERKRDVYEWGCDGELDINGWDLDKTLFLFHKSNPVLYEWLQSPIVYRDTTTVLKFLPELRKLIPEYYDYDSVCYHYSHMAENNIREYIGLKEVKLKKYLYILRPLLAINWVRERKGPVPIEFDKLVDILQDEKLKSDIRELVKKKMEVGELGKGPPIPSIEKFITHYIKKKRHDKEFTKKVKTHDKLNDFFMDCLEDAWGYCFNSNY